MAIAVAYDGSDSAKKALEYAITEARQRGAAIFLVYVLTRERTLDTGNPIIRGFSFSDVADIFRKAVEESIHEMLVEAETRVKQSGLEWEARVLNMGKGVGQDIVRFLEEEHDGIDLVVVGVKKTSPTGKALFGSTLQYLVLHSPCPVITVNPGAR